MKYPQTFIDEFKALFPSPEVHEQLAIEGDSDPSLFLEFIGPWLCFNMEPEAVLIAFAEGNEHLILAEAQRAARCHALCRESFRLRRALIQEHEQEIKTP